MSSDTAGTVKRARELMDSGVDPIVLMSQLASLIMDIIAGTYNVTDPRYSLVFGGRNCEYLLVVYSSCFFLNKGLLDLSEVTSCALHKYTYFIARTLVLVLDIISGI